MEQKIPVVVHCPSTTDLMSHAFQPRLTKSGELVLEKYNITAGTDDDSTSSQ
jgi:hypothetical protein